MSIEKLRAAISTITKWGDYAIDLETNGLRPFTNDPRILTCAVSNYEKTYAFPIQHRETPWNPKEIAEIYKELLPKMLMATGKRIAHNSKFEQEWLLRFCGDAIVYDVEWHDSMAQAYSLDERAGKALQDLSIIHLGFDIKSLSNLDAERLDEYPLQDVLRYNAYDAKYTYLLFFLLADELEKEGLWHVYEMHNERAGPIALAQSRGLVPNTPVIKQYHAELSTKIADLKQQIAEHPSVIKYSTNNKFSPTSNPNVLEFMKSVVPKDTRNLITAVDEEVLSLIDHPVAKLILELRKYVKQHNTYVEPLLVDDE